MYKLGLDNIRNLCNKLGDPQDKLRFIHIAGTNGKGSTGAYLVSILKTSNTVGWFSSPAVFADEEIIKVNNRNISKADYKEGMEIIDNACLELVNEGKDAPSIFERQTALAFWYFLKKSCDIVVLECGMGGEGDATNIVSTTEAAVFTSISMDHIEYLGNDLTSIAKVKSGIIKKGCKVYTAEQPEEVIKVLRDKASDYGIEVNIIDEQSFEKGELKIAGVDQPKNASLAGAVALGLPDAYGVTEKTARNGLHNATIRGRFELVSSKPDIIIDGAHNEGASISLRNSIKAYLKSNRRFNNGSNRIVFVIGMLFDKDHKKVLENTVDLATDVLTVSTFGERGYSAGDLAGDVLEFNRSVTSIGGVEEALEIAVSIAGKGGLVVVFGSFTILKAALRWIDSHK